MKVGLVYLICFDGSNDAETREARDGLIKKYGSKGLDRSHIIDVFINQQTIYYQLMKDKGVAKPQAVQFATKALEAKSLPIYSNGVGNEPFEKLNNPANGDLALGGKGVGVYFLFHGTPGNADIASNVLKAIVVDLMKIHPGGSLRKVVFVTCGYANSTINKGLKNTATSNLLQKFATALSSVKGIDKQSLPKLAGYVDGVFVSGETGSKFGDKDKTQPIASLQNKKIAYTLNSSGEYQKCILVADDDRWHDPVVATTIENNTVLLSGSGGDVN